MYIKGPSPVVAASEKVDRIECVILLGVDKSGLMSWNKDVSQPIYGSFSKQTTSH